MQRMTVKAAELQPGDVILLPRVSVIDVKQGKHDAIQIVTEKGYPVGYKATDDVAILREGVTA